MLASDPSGGQLHLPFLLEGPIGGLKLLPNLSAWLWDVELLADR